jgi:SAM-dependent methyltransferase
MTQFSNAEYISRTADLESRLPKDPVPPPVVAEKKVRFYQDAYRTLRGFDLPPHATVLDYGCSFGSVVNVLLSAGYNAFGIDILEYWGKDRDLCGRVPLSYSPEITGRLRLVDPEDGKLPFDDQSIDMIVSDQVLEHVFDCAPVFREHARVLKPGGLAVHRFPRRYAPVEPHTWLPFAPLSRYKWYLTLWAVAGYRNYRQRGLSWRDTVTSSEATFRTTHYVSRKTMLATARQAGLVADFMDHLPISDSRVGHLYRRLDRLHLARVANPLLMLINMNDVLVLKNPGRRTASR